MNRNIHEEIGVIEVDKIGSATSPLGLNRERLAIVSSTSSPRPAMSSSCAR